MQVLESSKLKFWIPNQQQLCIKLRAMPFVNCFYNTNAEVNEDVIVSSITSAISTALGKPIEYICVNLTKSKTLYFGGTRDPCAMIQVIEYFPPLK